MTVQEPQAEIDRLIQAIRTEVDRPAFPYVLRRAHGGPLDPTPAFDPAPDRALLRALSHEDHPVRPYLLANASASVREVLALNLLTPKYRASRTGPPLDPVLEWEPPSLGEGLLSPSRWAPGVPPECRILALNDHHRGLADLARRVHALWESGELRLGPSDRDLLGKLIQLAQVWEAPKSHEASVWTLILHSQDRQKSHLRDILTHHYGQSGPYGHFDTNLPPGCCQISPSCATQTWSGEPRPAGGLLWEASLWFRPYAKHLDRRAALAVVDQWLREAPSPAAA